MQARAKYEFVLTLNNEELINSIELNKIKRSFHSFQGSHSKF